MSAPVFFINTRQCPRKFSHPSVVVNTNQLIFLIDYFAFIFFIFEVFRLHANKAKKPLFSHRNEKNFTSVSLHFDLSENERRTITGKGEQIKLGIESDDRIPNYNKQLI
jgi:hypothetical protein